MRDDHLLNGTPIRDAATKDIMFALAGTLTILDPGSGGTVEDCRLRLEIELIIRSMTNPP